MKTLGVVLMVILCMVVYQINAEAVLGVADDVPGQDLVIPFICAKPPLIVFPPGNGMDTLWSIADTKGYSNPDNIARVVISDINGVYRLDFEYHFSPFDVVNVRNSCSSIISLMSAPNQTAMEITLNGKTYYAGYMTVQDFSQEPPADRFVGWASLVENLGSAATFKPFQAEGGLGLNFEESIEYPVTAETLIFRYNIQNAFPETKNWWIILTAAPPLTLDGMVCDEEENCVELDFLLTHRLNFINVASLLPGTFAGYPKAGFAKLTVSTPDESIFAWSYMDTCTDQGFWWILRPLRRISFCRATRSFMYPADRTYLHPE